MKTIFIGLFFLFCFFTAKAQPLVLATYQYADNDRIANIRPLADHIARQTGKTVEVKSFPSVHAFIEGIQNSEVDIALINTFGYLLLEASSKKSPMQACAALKVREGAQDNYKTAIVASQRVKIDTLAELRSVAKRCRLMLVSPGSTSGNLVPRLVLSSVGIKNPEKAFRTLSYGNNHKATLDSLVQGKADIAAFGSSEYSNLVRTGNAQKIKLLWISPEIPLGPVLIHDRIDPELRESITGLLLRLDQTDSDALEAVKRGWSEAKHAERYIAIDSTWYDPFKAQLGSRKSMTKILKQFSN